MKGGGCTPSPAAAELGCADTARIVSQLPCNEMPDLRFDFSVDHFEARQNLGGGKCAVGNQDWAAIPRWIPLPVINAIMPVATTFRPRKGALVISAVIAKLKSIRRALFTEPDYQVEVFIREPPPPRLVTLLTERHLFQHCTVDPRKPNGYKLTGLEPHARWYRTCGAATRGTKSGAAQS
jgi:hypothetical protein